jgi:hypothetical protein
MGFERALTSIAQTPTTTTVDNGIPSEGVGEGEWDLIPRLDGARLLSVEKRELDIDRWKLDMAQRSGGVDQEK